MILTIIIATLAVMFGGFLFSTFSVPVVGPYKAPQPSNEPECSECGVSGYLTWGGTVCGKCSRDWTY